MQITTIHDGVLEELFDTKDSAIVPKEVSSVSTKLFAKEHCDVKYLTLPDYVTSFCEPVNVLYNMSNIRVLQVGEEVVKDIETIKNVCMAILVHNEDSIRIFVYADKSTVKYGCQLFRIHNTYQELIKEGKWDDYDLELINNGPLFKYQTEIRLLGMLGRLMDPNKLTEQNKKFMEEYIVKNVKKLILLAEELDCHQIVKAVFDFGLVNDKSEKAVRELIKNSSNSRISSLHNASICIKKSRNKKSEGVKSEESDPKSEIETKFASMYKSINGDRIIKKMKLLGKEIPSLRFRDGSVAPNELVLFVIASYFEKGSYPYGIDKDADDAVALLSYNSVCDTIDDILNTEVMQDYPGIIPAICRYANGSQISRIINQSKKWKSSSKGLAKSSIILSDTREAMVMKYEEGSLYDYARLRNTTEKSILDGFLYDFGFDSNGVIEISLGETVLELHLAKNMDVEIYDVNKNKIVKSIPKRNVDPDEWRRVSDSVKDIKRNLKRALSVKKKELYKEFLSGEEKSVSKWKEEFEKNIFLKKLATLLVWAQDKATFLLTEQGAIDYQGKDYQFSKSDIRLAHPMEMSIEEVECWQNYFVENDIKQPFQQIWEPTYKADDINPDRYKSCRIRTVYLKDQEKRGIEISIGWRGTYYLEHLWIEGFDINAVNCDGDDGMIIIEKIIPKEWNRQQNMIIAFLDRITLWDRIKNDDISVVKMMNSFTVVQVMECISLAQESNAINVLSELMDYKKTRFPNYNQMDEFIL